MHQTSLGLNKQTNCKQKWNPTRKTDFQNNLDFHIIEEAYKNIQEANKDKVLISKESVTLLYTKNTDIFTAPESLTQNANTFSQEHGMFTVHEQI